MLNDGRCNSATGGRAWSVCTKEDVFGKREVKVATSRNWCVSRSMVGCLEVSVTVTMFYSAPRTVRRGCYKRRT